MEAALLKVTAEENIQIKEFTVAPFISQTKGKSYHEWFIEFEESPADLSSFAKKLDDTMRQKNVYYDDLIAGHILEPLKITPIQKNGFVHYMKSLGKLGGQNKVARLSNDRVIAEGVERLKVEV